MKRYGKGKTQHQRQIKRLTPNDRQELEKFQALLIDMAVGMKEDDLADKHGRAYLGLEEGAQQQEGA